MVTPNSIMNAMTVLNYLVMFYPNHLVSFHKYMQNSMYITMHSNSDDADDFLEDVSEKIRGLIFPTVTREISAHEDFKVLTIRFTEN